MLAHFGHHVLTSLPIPLLPMIRSDFNLDYTQSGLIISAFALAHGFSQLPAGWIADRIGRRIMITFGISGVALCGLFVGLAQSYWMLIVFLVFMGISGGGYHPASVPLISAAVEPRHRGRALGLHMVGGSSSNCLTPLIAAAMAAAWGWRSAFIGLSLPDFILGIVLYHLLRRNAENEVASKKTDTGSGAFPTPSHLKRLISIITLSTIVHAIFFSIVVFIPLFLVDQFGIHKETAAAFLAIYYTTGFWAPPLGGYLSDRFGRLPVILAACYICGPIIYLLNFAPYAWGIVIVLLIAGMTSYLRIIATESYLVSEAPERYRSTAMGIYYFSGRETGGLLTPVMGYLIDNYGFHFGFAGAGGTIFVLTLICSMLLLSFRTEPNIK